MHYLFFHLTYIVTYYMVYYIEHLIVNYLQTKKLQQTKIM
jgi:hypothetical protein